LPGAVEAATQSLAWNPQTQEHLKRVTQLVEGFETPFGLELLATIHWVVKKDGIHSIDDVIARIHSWNPHKRQFTERQITLAATVLERWNWIDKLRESKQHDN
jgi:hypothetical protein